MINKKLIEKILNWVDDYSLSFKDNFGTGYNLHLTISENDLPPVDVIQRLDNEKYVIFMSKVVVNKEHINNVLLKSSKDILIMISRIKELLLTMNIEYITSDMMGDIPTSWELLTKVHINDLSPKSFWENYLKIKNSIYIVILSFQREATQYDFLDEKNKQVHTGKIISMDVEENEYILLEFPHKPEDASLSFHISSLFEPFLNKNVKISIEEIKDSKT